MGEKGTINNNPRRLARIAVMSLYYEREIKDSADENSTTLIDFEDVLERSRIDKDNLMYIDRMLSIYENQKDLLDETISANLKDWKLDRISKVDLSVLRTAVAEMMFMEDIPNSVSVNEAVEIAKIYSDKGADRFVNGILRNIARTMEK